MNATMYIAPGEPGNDQAAARAVIAHYKRAFNLEVSCVVKRDARAGHFGGALLIIDGGRLPACRTRSEKLVTDTSS